MEKVEELYRKYGELVRYVIIGALTTAVSFGSYALLARVLLLEALPATIIAEALAITFAYFASRLYVFEDRAHGAAIVREVLSFYASRLFTLGLNALLMYITVERMGLNDLAMKAAISVLVIVLNYVLSKLLVFRKSQ